MFSSRTAGSILGAGFDAFISDWDKISATVSVSFIHKVSLLKKINRLPITFEKFGNSDEFTPTQTHPPHPPPLRP